MVKVANLSPQNEAVTVWAFSFALLIVARLGLGPTAAKVAATVSFLYFPLFFMRRRDEEYADYGLSSKRWQQSVKWFLIVFLVVAPAYLACFWGVLQVLSKLPPTLSRNLFPFEIGRTVHFSLRFPPKFWEWVVDQFLVVGLSEEFFYRGYLQKLFHQKWPSGHFWGGVRIGPAFWMTAILFALGHLAIFELWRLAVFFPALLFGWLREKTGGLLAPILLHGSFNLLAIVLETSMVY